MLRGVFMNEPANQLVVDLELIRRLDKNGPRYTSYPTADRFIEAFNAESYRQWMANWHNMHMLWGRL